MDTWYLKDANGGVVGPVGRDVAVELLRSRPGLFTSASRDGVTWSPVRPSMSGGESPAARAKREEQESQRVLFELDRFRELEAHSLFGVPRAATLSEFRQGFQTISARFSPDRLPADASPVLREAHRAVFQHLSNVMAGVEKRLAPPVPGSRPSSPRFESSPSNATMPPVWSLDALKLKQMPHALEGTIDVTSTTAFIFSAHRLINLQNQGVFFPCVPPLSLGTRLELTFRFADAGRDIRSRGAVALESAQLDARQNLRGFGVRLDNLSVEDKGFMLREVNRLSPQPRAR